MLKGLLSGILLSSAFFVGISFIPSSTAFKLNKQPESRESFQISNHTPTVKIIQPQKNAVYIWNSLIPYSVDVSDAEDGESKYQEIQSMEVLVKLKYVENAVKSSAYLKL